MMRSSNPSLSASTFSHPLEGAEKMTIQGTANKSFLLIGIVLIAAYYFITAIAALKLVMDFDFIEQGAESGAPKFMEWYAAFGLLVTLIWLYLEILRLLGKGRKR